MYWNNAEGGKVKAKINNLTETLDVLKFCSAYAYAPSKKNLTETLDVLKW